ncbi:hypothetical protein A1Q2_05540 [Trichosporon asahii var. asahii CBS 8904]|uniref:Uncharacterized protein n=2 Tax=Trichosporon asahii var. asahii TaxID=189963 RepID=K1VLM0_TRIAC|nr:hypothetical protein A1Q1_06024 [Trichosporon asahii var. asahii CBS 2479]EJT45578.1 hypothetical protein A1Q1_06024 [Trichosporon asahii var. asahii CBS 2479]EKD00197.1 hypothetical protein A1Q2_05540 [Trichosporon asahii var. asahii CBS 8904]
MRLRALEGRVGRASDNATPLVTRVAALTTALEDAVAGVPALKQFYDNYDRYAPLLSTQAEDLLETEDRVRPADLLPLESKAQLVISAAPDLIEAEKGLREIDILDKRGVAGAGDLEQITTLAPALEKGQAELKVRRERLARERAAVSGLVARYNEFTETVSELFLQLHQDVTRLEEGVARAERAKRKEEAERY